MKRKIYLITFCLFIFIIVISGAVLINRQTKKETQACFKNHCFEVELAIEPEQRSQGLMFREQLDLDQGMLFVFEKEGDYPFWMKNTLIPLDIIWINENKEIVFIIDNAQPCREATCSLLEPKKEAKYVLEINGGMAKKIGLAVGDKINFEIK